MNETSNSQAQQLAEAAHHWHLEIDTDGMAWLCIDKEASSTNVLSRDLLIEFDGIVRALAAAPPRGLILYSGKQTGFVLGADINEFPQIETSAQAHELVTRGQQMLACLESLPCTTVAMIDGLALGGGLELALWPATSASRRTKTGRRWVCRKSSSACIRASAARSGPSA